MVVFAGPVFYSQKLANNNFMASAIFDKYAYFCGQKAILENAKDSLEPLICIILDHAYSDIH